MKIPKAPLKRSSFFAYAVLVVSILLTAVVFLPPFQGWQIALMIALLELAFAALAFAFIGRVGNKVRGIGLIWITAALAAITLVGGIVLQFTSNDRYVYLDERRGSAHCQTYTWPTTEITERLPVPHARLAEIDSADNENVRAYMCLVSRHDFDDYVAQTKARGFKTLRENQTRFYGEDKEGYQVYLEYTSGDGGCMIIYADDPMDSDSLS